MILSICIATYNRAAFIGETLASLSSQLCGGVEIVIVDGASTDDTEAVVSEYVRNHPPIRYYRESANLGVDADFDKAVGYASGRYCWLFADDDLLAPGAVARVLKAIESEDVGLVLVDSEVRDFHLAKRLRQQRLPFTGERTYTPAEADDFLKDAGIALTFIGGTIIARDLWLTRCREPYIGSLFIHVGVILQNPAIQSIKIIGEPLVIIRLGNAMWRPRAFEIWAIKWPSLIWSFPHYRSEAKTHVTRRDPWRSLGWLLKHRAMGVYSIDEYNRFFRDKRIGLDRVKLYLTAVFPGRFINLIGVAAATLLQGDNRDGVYELAVCSRFSNPASRTLARFRLGELGDR